MISQTSRRTFLAAGGAALSSTLITRATSKDAVLGQGDFRYRVVPGWGNLGVKTPVQNEWGFPKETGK